MQTQPRGADTERRGSPAPGPALALLGLAAIGLAAARPALGQATAFDYAPGRCVIRAAVLNVAVANPTPPPLFLLQGNPNLGTDIITNPGVMEGLRRASFKPLHWDIINPRGTTGVNGPYVPEGSPTYWQVVLQADAHTDLRGYDLLYVCSLDLTVLTDYQVDSLVEAVNEGAVLWIDSAHSTTGPGGTGSAWDSSPFFFRANNAGLSVTGLADLNHALVTRPFWLTANQMGQIGVAGQSDRLDVSLNLPHLFPVLVSGNDVVAAAGRFGGGGIVVTGGNVGSEIAGWAGAGIANPLPAQAADVMFAYNIMAWATGWTQSRQSARGTGASISEARADLDVKWQTGDIGPIAGSPVVDEAGRLFVASYAAQPRLYCYDSNPEQDIDGDGNVDDGVAGYRGEGADLVWSTNLPGTPRSTSPCATRAVIGSGNNAAPTDVVLVSLVSGGNPSRASVVCYNAATGALISTTDLAPSGNQVQTAGISTPVVHDGYVYVLLSEYDPNAPGTAPEDKTYGRVCCFDLAQGGNFLWIYPDPAFAPANAPASVEYQFALPPFDTPAWVADANRAELPPVPTPTPAVGNAPQYSGTVPNAPTTFDPHLDTAIYCGTPASRGWNGTAPVTQLQFGSDFALVPTPVHIQGNNVTLPSPDPFARNRRHYWVRLATQPSTAQNPLPPLSPGTAPPPGIDSVWTYYDPGIASTGSLLGPMPSPLPTNGFFQYTPEQVQTFLAALPNATGAPPYWSVQAGCAAMVVINYHYQDTAGQQQEDYNLRTFLPGPVLYERRYPSGGSRVSGQSVGPNVVAGARSGGGVIALDPVTGEKRWSYDPTTSLPPGLGAGASAEAAPGEAKGTIVATASRPVSANEGYLSHVAGLDPRPDVTVTLRITPPLVGNVAVDMASGAGALQTIDPGCYQVDYANARITFPSATADNVTSGGTPVGAVYGRMLVVTYTPASGGAAVSDVYAAPGLARWEYAATPQVAAPPTATIRLNHHPVIWRGGAGVRAMLVNGMAVTGFQAGETTVTVNGVEWLPTGLISLGNATFTIPQGTPATRRPLRPGAEVLFQYQAMTPDGLVTIPNAYEPDDRRQFAWFAGRSLAPPTAANDGQTIFLGTESFALDATVAGAPLTASPWVGGDGVDFSTAPFATAWVPDPTRTLLALSWDKVANTVRGQLVRPAYEPPAPAGAPRVPVVSGSPAVDGETVFVASRLLSTLPNTTDPTDPTWQPYGYGGVPVAGYLSALVPRRTIIADDQRIVETVGSRVDWVCTGPRCLDPAWLNTDAAANAAWPGNAPEVRLPFSRPAKAVRLAEEDFRLGLLTGLFVPGTYHPESGLGPGDTLVVDTGNNRVVEVDRKGRQVWPLDNYDPARTRRPGDGLGFDYYRSPANTNLGLNHPSDAYRYWAGGAPNTAEMHTVIADTGNYRVIDVITTFGFTPPDQVTQTHRVEVLTPSHIMAPATTRPGERVRVAYTKTQPLFDPNAAGLVGYLCAASNLNQLVVIDALTGTVNPPATQAMGSGTWAMWAWLYASDADGNPATDDRLIFENIGDMRVSMQRDVDGVSYCFLSVVCGHYRGPLANPYTINVPQAGGQAAGPICLDFRIGAPGGFDPTNTATWRLYPSAGGWQVPYWYYTDIHYHAGPLGHLIRPGQTTPDNKSFAPASCQRLPFGRHLIANYAGLVENLTHANLQTATTFDSPPSLGSDVFEVETRYGTANDPTTEQQIIDVHKAIPDPWDDEWPDQFNQPSYAQRTLESVGPVGP